jgi:bifunctional non-homologous end joining protein LigD
MSPVIVEVTHADRELFPGRSGHGITKGELVDYYSGLAPVMLPHLRDRPLMLQRFPRGIDEHGFVQKDFAQTLPDWMSRVEVPKEGGTVVHPLADRRRALVWLANQDCVTPHVFLSRRQHLDMPDRLVFDLDPSDGDFAEVIETARAVADVLEDLGLTSYVQTTGSRGLHVVTPVKADTGFDAAREFARGVAAVVAADAPTRRTVEIRKNERGDRVYLDVMRNGYAQTAVAPYAVRAKPGAPVATPLHWEELSSRGMRPDRFTLRDVPQRIADQGAPWADLNRHARSLSNPMRRLAKLTDRANGQPRSTSG